MTKLERIAKRREHAWRRWTTLCEVSEEVAKWVWAWVLGWDAAYHECTIAEFLNKHG